ncbi:hypothetical protein J7L33_06700 [Candidatus Bathyarchaeota archaeon]|nr:hypothetical protein [Candidatus Bathyarchaeota archaeon]
MLSKREREYLEHLAQYGFAFDKYKGDYPYVLKHRIERKAFKAIQDLKLIASVYWILDRPRGGWHEKGTSLEKLIYILEQKFGCED